MTEERSEDNSVSIDIDLASGKLVLRAPLNQVKTLLEDLRAFLPHLAEASGTPAQRRPSSREEPPLPVNAQPIDKSTPKQKRGKPKSASSSSSKTEKSGAGLGSWSYSEFTPIDLGIGDEKEIELSALYKEKSPTTNYERTAVALWVLGKVTGNNDFNYDQIYQAMRLAAEPKPPSNLSEAVGRLVSNNYVAKNETSIRLKIQGLDWVEKEMPKS